MACPKEVAAESRRERTCPALGRRKPARGQRLHSQTSHQLRERGRKGLQEETPRGHGESAGPGWEGAFVPEAFPIALGCAEELGKVHQQETGGGPHTDELHPDLTEAGTFLEGEGLDKECSPQPALRRGLIILGASVLGPVGQGNEL